MRRHPGSKAKLSKRVIRYFPDNMEGLDYYEPFGGVGYTLRRIIREGLPFRSFHISDKFEWAYNYLAALRGDLLFDGVDIVDQIEEYRERLTPEDEHREEIRSTFEQMKPRCRAGDPFAYLFLCTYANGQYVYPQRLDTASFHAQYLRGGISTLTRAKALDWRTILQQATVTQTDAFDLLPTLGADAFCYIDSPYVNNLNGHKTFRLYGCDFELEDHHRLAEILGNAPFKWCISYGDRPLVKELYKGFTFRWLYRPYRGTRTKYPSFGEWLIYNY